MFCQWASKPFRIKQRAAMASQNTANDKAPSLTAPSSQRIQSPPPRTNTASTNELMPLVTELACPVESNTLVESSIPMATSKASSTATSGGGLQSFLPVPHHVPTMTSKSGVKATATCIIATIRQSMAEEQQPAVRRICAQFRAGRRQRDDGRLDQSCQRNESPHARELRVESGSLVTAPTTNGSSTAISNQLRARGIQSRRTSAARSGRAGCIRKFGSVRCRSTRPLGTR